MSARSSAWRSFTPSAPMSTRFAGSSCRACRPTSTLTTFRPRWSGPRWDHIWARAASARRSSIEPEPIASEPFRFAAHGLRKGCVRIADRYHLAGVRNAYAAILGPQMRRAPATIVRPGTGPTGAPWGRPEDDHTDRRSSTARQRGSPSDDHRAHGGVDQRLGSRPAPVRPGGRPPGHGRGHAPRPARAAPRADRPLPRPHGRRQRPGLHRLPGPAQPRAAARPRAGSATTRTSRSTRSRPSRCG